MHTVGLCSKIYEIQACNVLEKRLGHEDLDYFDLPGVVFPRPAAQ